jgi:hypothetical protein
MTVNYNYTIKILTKTEEKLSFCFGQRRIRDSKLHFKGHVGNGKQCYYLQAWQRNFNLVKQICFQPSILEWFSDEGAFNTMIKTIKTKTLGTSLLL